MSALFVGLISLVVAVVSFVAYSSVVEAAVMRSSDRLSSIARELASASARAVAARSAILRELARNPVIRRTAGGSTDSPRGDTPLNVTVLDEVSDTPSEIAAVFSKTRSPGDSTLVGWYVVDVNRVTRYGAPLAPVDFGPLDKAISDALKSGTVGRSVIYPARGRLHVWNVASIEEDGRIIGVLAELRRLGSSAPTQGLLARLSGQDATVYFASRGSGEWGSIRGLPVRSPIGDIPIEALADSNARVIDSGVPEPLMVAGASIQGTPWHIVLTQPEASILARPRENLGRLLLVGAIVIVVGALGAGWLIRFETRSISELRRAADAMAAGDYSQVVRPEGAEETAALADAFNVMASRISDAHATLAQQNAALQRGNDAKARFLAVMSHEMRTPLNAIGGYAELLTLGVHGTTTAVQKDVLERIGRNQAQLLRLVTDILHYARHEATPLPISREPMSLREQFNAVRETFAQQCEHRRVKLVIVPTEGWVCADAARVQQVLNNLVSNALQFTESGGVVSLQADKAGEFTVLTVADTGAGIAIDEQAAIFEPFVQADNSLTRRNGGVGLGLAIVQQLVTAMGGRVEVESEPGRGSRFFVSLPSASSPDMQRADDCSLEIVAS